MPKWDYKKSYKNANFVHQLSLTKKNIQTDMMLLSSLIFWETKTETEWLSRKQLIWAGNMVFVQRDGSYLTSGI